MPTVITLHKVPYDSFEKALIHTIEVHKLLGEHRIMKGRYKDRLDHLMSDLEQIKKGLEACSSSGS